MDPKLNLSIRPLAHQDLLDIWGYTNTRWGEAKADKYLLALEKVMHDLTSLPSLGRPIDSVKKQCRLIHHNQHLIIYQILQNEISIIRVLHERMNVIEILIQ